MGYTLELWGLSVERLAEELRSPSLQPAEVTDAEGMEDILDQWHELAASVAALTGQTEAEPSEEEACYVALVVRTLGAMYGSLNHTSSGGAEFRERLRTTGASDLGGDVIEHLLERALVGLEWFDYPLVGWVTAPEIEDVPREPEPAVQADENLRTLHQVVVRAAESGTDIVSIYL